MPRSQILSSCIDNPMDQELVHSTLCCHQSQRCLRWLVASIVEVIGCIGYIGCGKGACCINKNMLICAVSKGSSHHFTTIRNFSRFTIGEMVRHSEELSNLAFFPRTFQKQSPHKFNFISLGASNLFPPQTTTFEWLEINWMSPNLHLEKWVEITISIHEKNWLFRLPGIYIYTYNMYIYYTFE